MYLGNNKTALASQEWLVNSFLVLLEEKSFDDISITELAERSGVSRQTFYHLFESKEELIEYYLNNKFKEYLEYIHQFDVVDLNVLSKSLFEFIEKNRSFFDIIVHRELVHLLRKRFDQYLNELIRAFYDKKGYSHLDYRLQFLASGLTGIIVYWIEQDYKLSINDLCVIMQTTLQFGF